jgi:hypothetical protein
MPAVNRLLAAPRMKQVLGGESIEYIGSKKARGRKSAV